MGSNLGHAINFPNLLVDNDLIKATHGETILVRSLLRKRQSCKTHLN